MKKLIEVPMARMSDAAIVDPDAIKIGELYRKAKRGTADAAKQLLECGVMLRAKKNSLPHGAWLSWLDDNEKTLGFESPRTAQRLLTLSSNATLTSHLSDEQAIALSRKLWNNLGAHVGQNTGEDEWYTPDEFIQAARAVMGGIDLDPASSREANEKIGATKIYIEEDDGLSQLWSGRVWMNPPYKQPLVTQFCERLVGQLKTGNVKEACVLVNNATETAFFQDMAEEAAAICFPRSRVQFWNPDKASCSPLQGQAILYFGSKADEFKREFSRFGFVAWMSNR